MNPRKLWEDNEMYDKKAAELAEKFKENFEKFNNVPKEILETRLNEIYV